MKIVVLAGGLSSEREVSLVTGASVCRALRENGHQAIVVDLFLGLEAVPGFCRQADAGGGAGSIGVESAGVIAGSRADGVGMSAAEAAKLTALFDAPDGLCPPAEIATAAPDLDAVRKSRRDRSRRVFGPGVLELCQIADLVFLGLHGRDGEDGRVQGTLDLLGVPYTGGGCLASGLAMDKAMTKRMMDSAGIPNAKWKLLDYGEDEIDGLAASLPMPCVIKVTTGGSSLGVFLPEDRTELADALRKVRAYGGQVLWEERIYGREVTVGVLGDRALPAVEILPAEGGFDYTNKYQAGGAREICPAPISPEQQAEAGRLALLLHRTLGLEVYSRTDFLLDGEGRFWCLEINSLPGLTPASLVPKEAAAVGMGYNELCEEIVRLSKDLKRRD